MNYIGNGLMFFGQENKLIYFIIFREKLFFTQLNENFKNYIFENIYFPCAQKSDNENFNVLIDIKLKNWIDNVLPSDTVQFGWKVLSEQFLNILIPKNDNLNGNGDENLFRNLKNEVAKTVLKQHQWDPKALDVLVMDYFNNKLYFELIDFFYCRNCFK